MLLTILLLAIQTLNAQPNRFGLPTCDAPDQQLATRTAFTLCLSNTHRIPVWTAYQLTPEMLESPSVPRQHFRRDPDLASSATDADYRNSGFHRSHLVPARDLASSPDSLRENSTSPNGAKSKTTSENSPPTTTPSSSSPALSSIATTSSTSAPTTSPFPAPPLKSCSPLAAKPNPPMPSSSPTSPPPPAKPSPSAKSKPAPAWTFSRLWHTALNPFYLCRGLL
ncbi:MAG: DNA/RNA non-specific endonuclease [Acidobacteria bacterium]|nr:DNA/RNA non-specific endonuclease [Acidobacteriota bacterium]